MQRIIGHIGQRSALTKLFRSGKLPASLLLCGPTGIGKSLVARELASAIFCEDQKRQGENGGCGLCKSCKVFESGNMPDYHFVCCDNKEESAIDQIRDLLYSLNLRAFSSKFRVVIFNEAEKLNMQVSNLLLKSIEEPRSNTHFMLVSSNASKLLPTIVSRCQEWRFDELSDNEVKEALGSNPQILDETGLSKDSVPELIALCDGSLGNIRNLASRLDSWANISSSLEKIAAGEAAKVYELASFLSKNRDDLRMNLQLMRIYSRRKMREVEESLPKYKWAITLSNLIAAETMIFERNLNSLHVLTCLLLQLHSEPSLDKFFTLNDKEHLISKMTI